MAGAATWLKRTGGALFAVLMLCLTLVPTLDSVLCGSDAAPAASIRVDGQHASALGHGDTHREGAGDACVHGHCHQPASPASPAEMQLTAASVATARLTPPKSGLPPSRAPDGPTEPPRA